MEKVLLDIFRKVRSIERYKIQKNPATRQIVNSSVPCIW